jgi:hypothetical protein
VLNGDRLIGRGGAWLMQHLPSLLQATEILEYVILFPITVATSISWKIAHANYRSDILYVGGNRVCLKKVSENTPFHTSHIIEPKQLRLRSEH